MRISLPVSLLACSLVCLTGISFGEDRPQPVKKPDEKQTRKVETPQDSKPDRESDAAASPGKKQGDRPHAKQTFADSKQNQAHRLDQMFERWDANHDGSISREEFSTGAAQLHKRIQAVQKIKKEAPSRRQHVQHGRRDRDRFSHGKHGHHRHARHHHNHVRWDRQADHRGKHSQHRWHHAKFRSRFGHHAHGWRDRPSFQHRRQFADRTGHPHWRSFHGQQARRIHPGFHQSRWSRGEFHRGRFDFPRDFADRKAGRPGAFHCPHANFGPRHGDRFSFDRRGERFQHHDSAHFRGHRNSSWGNRPRHPRGPHHGSRQQWQHRTDRPDHDRGRPEAKRGHHAEKRPELRDGDRQSPPRDRDHVRPEGDRHHHDAHRPPRDGDRPRHRMNHDDRDGEPRDQRRENRPHPEPDASRDGAVDKNREQRRDQPPRPERERERSQEMPRPERTREVRERDKPASPEKKVEAPRDGGEKE